MARFEYALITIRRAAEGYMRLLKKDEGHSQARLTSMRDGKLGHAAFATAVVVASAIVGIRCRDLYFEGVH